MNTISYYPISKNINISKINMLKLSILILNSMLLAYFCGHIFDYKAYFIIILTLDSKRVRPVFLPMLKASSAVLFLINYASSANKAPTLLPLAQCTKVL